MTHYWVLKGSAGRVRKVAELYEDAGGRLMTVFTDQPGLQFYSGNFLDGSAKGKNGVAYKQRSGLCLETQAFPAIGGVVHTHSEYATMFAQACREIPCLGTTHADHFNGPVPVTRFLRADEVRDGYERATGTIIIERSAGLDPLATPGVLVAGHAPFVWGRSARNAVHNSLILEKIAQMAFGSFLLNPSITALPAHIQEKHYQRKHGSHAYCGQKKQG